MQTQGAQHDPEHAWRSEPSAASQPAPPLGSSSTSQGAIQSGSRGNNLLGLALVGIGLFILLTRLIPARDAFNAGMILLIIASCVLFVAFWRHSYLLLIPGCILASLSVGVPFAGLTNGVSVLWGLGVGFLAIFFIGQLLFNVRTRWPFIPAVPLFAAGLIVAVVNLPIFFASNLMLLPLLLIAAGLYLGSRRTTS